MKHAESISLNMHQRKEMANKLIKKLISYQDYNKLIINRSNGSTNNQQIMNIDQVTSVKHGNAHPHIQLHDTILPPKLLFISNEE